MFEKNELIRSDVKGNAHTIYFPIEEQKTDTSYLQKRIGMNRVLASDLRIYVDKGEVKGITYFEKPDGIFYPMNQINKDEQFIKGFKLFPTLRPQSPLKMIE